MIVENVLAGDLAETQMLQVVLLMFLWFKTGGNIGGLSSKRRLRRFCLKCGIVY